MTKFKPVDLLILEKGGIDWEELRLGKAAVFAIAFQMGAAIQRGDGDQGMINTYERLTSLLGFLDYIQERAARTLGEKKVFGDGTQE